MDRIKFQKWNNDTFFKTPLFTAQFFIGKGKHSNVGLKGVHDDVKNSQAYGEVVACLKPLIKDTIVQL